MNMNARKIYIYIVIELKTFIKIIKIKLLLAIINHDMKCCIIINKVSKFFLY